MAEKPPKVSIKDADILTLLRPDLDAAKASQGEWAMKREDYYKAFRGAKYGNEREGWSQSVAPLVWTQHQSNLATLTDIFSDEFFTLKSDNTERADKFQKLIRYQMFRKQDGYKRMSDFLFNAGLYPMAVFKVFHKDDYDLTDEQYAVLTSDQMQQLSQDNKRQITKYDEVQQPVPNDPATGLPIADQITSYENVKVIRKDIKYSGPAFEVVQPWAFGYSSDCKLTDFGGIDGRLIYHGPFKLTLNDIRKREKAGIYRKGTYDTCKDLGSGSLVKGVDELAVEVVMDGVSEVIHDGSRSEVPNSKEDLTKELSVKECYCKLDIDKDGLLEYCIVTIIEDKCIAQVEENPYGRAPFRVGSMLPEPHKVHGIAPPSILEHEQKIETNLLRFIQDTAAQSCYRNPVTNDVRMQQMLQERKPFDVILGDPTRLGEVKTSPPDQFILKAWELLKGTNEETTGNSRYNQGSDGDSLNKMLDIETLIPMADGVYKQLKDIQDGDRIIGSDGKAVTVLKAHEIHFPERAYDIKFRSGDIINAGGEHLWTIQTAHDITRGVTRVVDTDDLFARVSTSKKSLYIPRVLRPDFENNVELPLDPYILGIWLGDGHSYAPRFTTEDADVVQSITEWAIANGGSVTVDKHQNAGNATTYYVKGLYAPLRKLDLFNRGKESFAKHIPEIYLTASYADRLELLRGIMDTDGCHHSGCTAVFVQKEGRLCTDVIALIQSLGGWPSVSRTYPGELDRRGAKYYQIAFSIFDNPFKLESKADKWIAPQRRVDRQKIVSITPTPITLMRCLTVDAADGLFCVGHSFTLTHNTATGISLISAASAKRSRMGAKALGNGAISGVIRDFVFINQKWPSQDPIVLLGQDIQINPGDLDGEYDIEIDIGVSPAEKQAIANQLDLLIQFMTQAGLQMGIATPQHVLKAIKKKFSQLNIVVDDLLVSVPEFQKAEEEKKQQPPQPDPAQIQAQMQQEQAQAQAQQSQAQFQMKMQESQQKMQFEATKQASEMEMMQMEAQLEQMKMQGEMEKLQLSIQQAREQHVLKMRELEASTLALETRNAAPPTTKDPLKLRGKK